MSKLTPPKYLDAIAKAAWRELVRHHDHLVVADSALLRNYASAVSMMRRAEKQLDEDGLTVQTSRGFGKHPAATILHEASQRITRCLRELRCSTANRPKASPVTTNVPVRFKVTRA